MERFLQPDAIDALGSISLLAFGVVFLAGLAMGLAPSSYALYPVIAGFVAGDDERAPGRGLLLSLAFVLGTASVDAALGALFALVGGAVLQFVSRSVVAWNFIIFAALAGFGLSLLRVIRIRWPVLKMSWKKAHTVPGAYALGIPFGLTACPACTPMVMPMLGAAAATGTWWFGAMLMFVFGLARGVPLLVVGVGAGFLPRLDAVTRWVPRVETAAGGLLLLAGIFFLVQAVRNALILLR